MNIDRAIGQASSGNEGPHLTPEEFRSRLEKKIEERFIPITEAIPGINTKGLESTNHVYGESGTPSYPIESTNPLGHANSVYSSELWDTNPDRKGKVLQFIEDTFEGQVVVDLGAGTSGLDYYIIDRAKASSYVGVDINLELQVVNDIAISDDKELVDFNFNTNVNPMYRFEYNRPAHEMNRTPAVLVQSDMLSFLRRLPDNSVSIFCSGIDASIISDKKHLDEIRGEIVRVLNPSGGYIGAHAHINLPNVENVEVESLPDGTITTRLFRYKKKASL